MIRYFFLGCLALVLTSGFAQEAELPQNWFNLDFQADGYPGMSTDKAYKELLAGKQGRTVIVAILDSGVDIKHEDLADIAWTNEDEIPGNGIDDDNNGYIDDVHGWNFIGGKDGTNIASENLEIVRLYRKYKAKYENRDTKSLSKDEKKEYKAYEEYGEIINKKREEMAPQVMVYSATKDAFDKLVIAIGKKKDDITLTDVEKFSTTDPMLSQASKVLVGYMNQGATFAEIYDAIEGDYNYYNESYNYNWNPDYDARSIVGDDPSNLKDRSYGNNDVQGPDAMHGTHVAGIVAAIRGNKVGMDGVADNVRIMSVRTVPNGDERDKDVANAIRYAVDNGAEVINMSFGKGYSPYKDYVDEAVRYAQKNDVLLVHGAGNDGQMLTLENNYPNDKYAKGGLFKPKYADNWIEVGATSAIDDEENLIADFSNYSSDKVDVFAPGVAIYSSVPDDMYKDLQGTSMASPMVAGVAALLRSYFPALTAEQVKEIIMESTVRYQDRVKQPGSDKVTDFTKLSVTGGVVNVYKAVQIAMETKGKRKDRA